MGEHKRKALHISSQVRRHLALVGLCRVGCRMCRSALGLASKMVMGGTPRGGRAKVSRNSRARQRETRRRSKLDPASALQLNFKLMRNFSLARGPSVSIVSGAIDPQICRVIPASVRKRRDVTELQLKRRLAPTTRIHVDKFACMFVVGGMNLLAISLRNVSTPFNFGRPK